MSNKLKNTSQNRPSPPVKLVEKDNKAYIGFDGGVWLNDLEKYGAFATKLKDHLKMYKTRNDKLFAIRDTIELLNAQQIAWILEDE